MKKKTGFVTFNQNNSGGFFYQNEDVDVFVIIEGHDLWQIQSKASEVFSDYRDYCPCCGERWNDDWLDERDIKDEPMIYGQSVYDYENWFEAKAIIYYLNGTKEIITIKEKSYDI